VLTQTVSKNPVSNIEVVIANSSGILSTLQTNGTGIADFIVPVGNFTIKLTTVGYSSTHTVNLTESQLLWLNVTVELRGNLSLTFENQFYQKLDLAFIVLRNNYYGTEFKVFTDSSGEILLLDIPWGNYSLFVTHNEDIFPKQIFSFATLKLELDILIDTEGPILSSGNYRFWQDNSFSVVWSSEFVSGFLSSTLSLITTTLTTLVIIVSVLSLLSIASVISHPIVANGRTIKTFQNLGADRQQILISLVLQLSTLGFIASFCGSLLGMWGMTILPSFQYINIGGVIIRPRVDIWLVLAILLSNLIVIIIKATQKVNELITSNLPNAQ
ncbi:MAG: FtsX-like permease family protein, partial [Candidatus Hodarchaeales archaeon]